MLFTYVTMPFSFMLCSCTDGQLNYDGWVHFDWVLLEWQSYELWGFWINCIYGCVYLHIYCLCCFSSEFHPRNYANHNHGQTAITPEASLHYHDPGNLFVYLKCWKCSSLHGVTKYKRHYNAVPSTYHLMVSYCFWDLKNNTQNTV